MASSDEHDFVVVGGVFADILGIIQPSLAIVAAGCDYTLICCVVLCCVCLCCLLRVSGLVLHVVFLTFLFRICFRFADLSFSLFFVCLFVVEQQKTEKSLPCTHGER